MIRGESASVARPDFIIRAEESGGGGGTEQSEEMGGRGVGGKRSEGIRNTEEEKREVEKR